MTTTTPSRPSSLVLMRDGLETCDLLIRADGSVHIRVNTARGDVLVFTSPAKTIALR